MQLVRLCFREAIIFPFWFLHFYIFRFFFDIFLDEANMLEKIGCIIKNNGKWPLLWKYSVNLELGKLKTVIAWQFRDVSRNFIK